MKNRRIRADCGEQEKSVVGNCDDWTVEELRRRARELGLSGYSGKRKGELIDMLRER